MNPHGDSRSLSDFVPFEEARIAEIDAMHAGLGASHYALLGVPVDADRVHPRQAYFERVKRFHPEVYEGYELWGRQALVEAIHAALTAAFTVLSDPHLRAGYDRSLGLSTPALDSLSGPNAVKTTGVRRASVVPGNDRPAMLPTAAPRAPVGAPRAGDAGGVRTRPGRSERAAAAGRELAPEDESIKARLERAESDAASLHFARMRNAARIHEKDGRWDYAVEAWLRAATAAPGDLEPLLGVVRASCEGGIDLRRAAEYARRATALATDSAEAFALLARVFLTAGRPASARGAVARALEIDPGHALAGSLARQLGRA